MSKMVLILLATSTSLVGTVVGAIRWNFQKGFLDYLSEAEMECLDHTAIA